MKGMNLPLCLWLFARRRAGITVMFHEVSVALRWQQPMRLNALGAVHLGMAFVLTRAAGRCVVSAAAWNRGCGRSRLRGLRSTAAGAE